MAITVVSATKDTLLHFEVCPSYTAKCTCATDSAGKPTPPHPTFEFAASSSDPKDTRSADQWAQACALEACRVVKAAQSQAATAVASAVGVSV